jgi:hypothetical protein
MATTKKGPPKDSKVGYSAKRDYKSSMIKGKGMTKLEAVKAAIRNEGGLGGKKRDKEVR